MKVIDDYFKKHTDKLSFVEIKNESIPFPILTERMISGIQDGSLQEEIKAEIFIEGMIFLLGIDSEFKYAKVYTKKLKSSIDSLEDYLVYNGQKYLNENNLFNAGIYFKALYSINPKNVNGIYGYGLVLQKIADGFTEEKMAEIFSLQALNLIESILDIDENFAPAYYLLGFYYRSLGKYTKTKLVWEKFLMINEDELSRQEIREELEDLSFLVEIEESLLLINRGEFEEALPKLIKLTKNSSNWELFYYTGLAFKGIGEVENAIEYFYESIKLGGQDVDIYNELGISLYQVGEVEEALKILGSGIEFNDMDYKIFYNRGTILSELRLYEKGLEDLKRAQSLSPGNEIIQIQINKIQESLKRG